MTSFTLQSNVINLWRERVKKRREVNEWRSAVWSYLYLKRNEIIHTCRHFYRRVTRIKCFFLYFLLISDFKGEKWVEFNRNHYVRTRQELFFFLCTNSMVFSTHDDASWVLKMHLYPFLFYLVTESVADFDSTIFSKWCILHESEHIWTSSL